MGLFLHLGIMLSGYRSNPPFIYRCYLVGGLEHEFYFSIQLGMSSSQLLLTHIFQRGCFTTNQCDWVVIFSIWRRVGGLISFEKSRWNMVKHQGHWPVEQTVFSPRIIGIFVLMELKRMGAPSASWWNRGCFTEEMMLWQASEVEKLLFLGVLL